MAAVASQHLYFAGKSKFSKERSSKGPRSSATDSLRRNSSNRRCAFTRKVARLVKQQRARFYIVRRCVTMLICWREYRDDSEDRENSDLE